MFDVILERILAQLDAAQRAAAASYEFAEVRSAFNELKQAVRDAESQDRQEASSLWTEISRAIRHTWEFFAERERFNRQVEALIRLRDSALDRAQMLVDRVGENESVPAELTEDADRWSVRSENVRLLAQRGSSRIHIDGWEGPASAGYSAAAKVQVNAMEELSGVMKSTAQGCAAGAMLNRAIFFVVGKEIKQATSRIKGAPGTDGDQYYRRTGKALAELNFLCSEIALAMAGNVAAGSSQSLSAEIEQTITMPNLLELGRWPTGTSAAGVVPADTGSGVTSSGDDGDLGGAGVGGNVNPSVNL